MHTKRQSDIFVKIASDGIFNAMTVCDDTGGPDSEALLSLLGACEATSHSNESSKAWGKLPQYMPTPGMIPSLLFQRSFSATFNSSCICLTPSLDSVEDALLF